MMNLKQTKMKAIFFILFLVNITVQCFKTLLLLFILKIPEDNMIKSIWPLQLNKVEIMMNQNYRVKTKYHFNIKTTLHSVDL